MKFRERFLITCRKTKTKVVNTANQKKKNPLRTKENPN